MRKIKLFEEFEYDMMTGPSSLEVYDKEGEIVGVLAGTGEGYFTANEVGKEKKYEDGKGLPEGCTTDLPKK
jgi:hypothetical protein